MPARDRGPAARAPELRRAPALEADPPRRAATTSRRGVGGGAIEEGLYHRETAAAATLLRELHPSDLPALAHIERGVFSNPWEEEAFGAFLAGAPLFARVATVGGEIAGYALGWCEAGEAELANLAVAPRWQGCGLAATLLEWVLAACRCGGARQIFLEVRASNARAQRLYRRHGFQEIGRRRGYYVNPREDALVYRARLAPPMPQPRAESGARD